MSDTSTQLKAQTLALAELELRRYEARLGVWKVVLGTFIVGLAGIVIPAAINLTTLVFENWQKEARFQLEKQTAHQQYIKDFFETAVNQDVELRIRFANYFANLSDGAQKDLWQGYHDKLVAGRNASRDRINQLEAELVTFQKVAQTEENVTHLDRIARELNWTYSEIGYVPLDRSTVQVVGGKKKRLYVETMNTILALTGQRTAIDVADENFKRFWVLHDRDLIDVESPMVARTMIAFGRELRRLAENEQPPSGALRELAVSVRGAMRVELESEAEPANTLRSRLFSVQQQALEDVLVLDGPVE